MVASGVEFAATLGVYIMIKSIEVSGKTEDEAIELALEQLGLGRDDVSVEIVERAKTGFLGLKNTPAIVKVQFEAVDDKTEQVVSYLTGLFEHMGIEVGIDAVAGDGAVNVTLTGKDPGALIGRRGETLDAIQHLANYSINRGSSGRFRINLDAENYRQRRNETLESLAARTAGKVLKYRRNMTLDPMNAYERHVIHSALQEYDNISTYSVGTEPNRRIVVAYGRNNDNRSSGSRSHENRHSGNQNRESRNSGSRSINSRSSDNSNDGSLNDDNAERSEGSTYREWR